MTDEKEGQHNKKIFTDSTVGRHRGFLHTVTGRFALIITIAVMGCLLIIEMASYTNMRSVVEKNSREKLSITCEKLDDALNEDYSRLLYISQAMSSGGVAGSIFDEYVNAVTFANRFVASQELDRLMSRLLFTTGDAFAVYYDTESNRKILGNERLTGDRLDNSKLIPVSSTADIDFHAPHRSLNKIGRQNVLSIIRRNSSSSMPDAAAYVEIPVTSGSFLDNMITDSGMEYIMVLTDPEGSVRYSGSSSFPAGTDFSDITAGTDSFGETDGFMWCSRVSDYGFHIVVLQSRAAFYRDSSGANTTILMSVVMGLILVMAVIALLYSLVIRKNAIVLKEIERVSTGDLERIEVTTGLEDYDNIIYRFNQMLDEIKQLISDVEQKERQEGRLEREILYYQINPHFLLNSLNSAFWLAKSEDKAGLDDYIAQLTGVLRYSLGKDNRTPTLSKELEVMRQYLKLQQYRHDFSYTVNVEEGDYLDIPVPRLFIQPVLENAIEHGMDEGGSLTIDVRTDDSSIYVTVTDNGIGVGDELIEDIRNEGTSAGSSLGIGLRYVKAMLWSQYGQDASIEIENLTGDEGSGTKVTIYLPKKDQHV